MLCDEVSMNLSEYFFGLVQMIVKIENFKMNLNLVLGKEYAELIVF